MTEVLEARKAYDDARDEARAIVDRARARLGMSIVQSREKAKVNGGPGSQSDVMEWLDRSREQVRAFEQAYRDWLRDHPGEPLD